MNLKIQKSILLFVVAFISAMISQNPGEPMSKLRLQIFDGSRQLFSPVVPFLVTIIDGNNKQLFRNYIQANQSDFDLPFYDNDGDNYSVVVWANGFKQAGFMPVPLSNGYMRPLDIMLISDSPGFNFAGAKWHAVSSRFPFLAGDLDGDAAGTRYDDLMETKEESLACFLNLGEAVSQIPLAQGTPLDYIKELRWDGDFAPANDRFFAWCDPTLIDQVKIGEKAGIFAVENNPGLFHHGSTSSWKQIQFGEANVQLTFHENDKKTINGLECVMVEPDIDYFKDLGAHAIFEVIPNGLTHSLTDPTQVYVLRWTAGRAAGVPEFAPMYTVTS